MLDGIQYELAVEVGAYSLMQNFCQSYVTEFSVLYTIYFIMSSPKEEGIKSCCPSAVCSVIAAK